MASLRSFATEELCNIMIGQRHPETAFVTSPQRKVCISFSAAAGSFSKFQRFGSFQFQRQPRLRKGVAQGSRFSQLCLVWGPEGCQQSGEAQTSRIIVHDVQNKLHLRLCLARREVLAQPPRIRMVAILSQIKRSLHILLYKKGKKKKKQKHENAPWQFDPMRKSRTKVQLTGPFIKQIRNAKCNCHVRGSSSKLIFIFTKSACSTSNIIEFRTFSLLSLNHSFSTTIQSKLLQSIPKPFESSDQHPPFLFKYPFPRFRGRFKVRQVSQ